MKVSVPDVTPSTDAGTASPDWARDPARRRTAPGLKHFSVRRLLYRGEAAGVACVACEWCERFDGETFLAEHGGRLPLSEAAPLFPGALEGLAYAHEAKLKELDAGDQGAFLRAGEPICMTVLHAGQRPR